ncbi:glycosyltransferase family 39 protein, partial [Candidatus Sumerlaeota bacterium]|nr:glycosyltransferase family 39 protein [Candidatus Sumerlaeota bacterium]
MARTPDFYRLPVLPDPSLAIMDRRGIWAFGGAFVLAAIVLVALLLRLDQIGHSPLGPAEACIWRDWQKPAAAIAGLERREVLTPLYHISLRAWGKVGSSDDMLRLHSTLWALALIAITFGLGAGYYSRGTGAFAALLLAVSPPLVSVSQQIGPATQAATFLLLNFACLMRAVFRQPSPLYWPCYMATGIAAIFCHPASVWIVLCQAFLALVFGPLTHRSGFGHPRVSREEVQVFYSRLALYGLMFAAVGWTWFRSTRPFDLAANRDGLWADWGLPTDSGLRALVQLLGVESLWGTRILPSGWSWTAAATLLVIVPLAYGGLVIRLRHLQEMGSFILLASVAPLALVVLLQGRLIQTQCQATELLVLALAPLALWASASVRLGLRGHARQILTGILIVGGCVITLWSSRIEAYPNWQIYRDALDRQIAQGHVALADGVARLADFELYLGSRLKIGDIGAAAEIGPKSGKGLAILSPLSPLYTRADPRGSLAPIVREWLKGRKSKPIAGSARAGDFFRIALWTDFDRENLRESIGRATFYSPQSSWQTLRPVRWFGPSDPGFERSGPTTRLVDFAPSARPTSASSDFGELSRAAGSSWPQVAV